MFFNVTRRCLSTQMMSCFIRGTPTCRIFTLTILICYFCSAYTNNFPAFENESDAPVEDLVLAVFKRQNLNRAAVFMGLCSNSTLFRKIAAHLQTSFITSTTLWQLDYTYFRTGILVDLRDCPSSKIIFQQGAVQSYLNSSYRWLVISNNSSSQETASLFQDIAFRLDTSITAAFHQGSTYSLFDLYKLSDCNAILRQPVGRFDVDQLSEWVDAENAPFRSKIHRFISTGLHVYEHVLSEPPNVVRELYNRLRGHPQLPSPYFSMRDFHVFLALCDLYNISVKPIMYSFSGYPNENGVYSGLLGGLQSHKIEISASKFLIDELRMRTGDYHISCDLFELDAIYYVGNTLETPGALLQPFSPGLWIGTALAYAILVVGLWYAGHWEMRSSETKVDLTATATMLLILGTFSGQGHIMNLRWYSTRAVIIVALVMGFLSASAYSAVIVRSLLSSPAPNIRNKEEFMASPLKMAVEDYYHLSKGIFGEKMEDSMRVLYNKKIMLPNGGGFRPMSEGFQGVLAQQWAMFSQVNNLLLEMTKATPGQVCRLAWIHDIDNQQRMLCPIVNKRSDLKGLLSRGYLLLRERGIHDRENLRHLAARIPCLIEHRRQWTPVKLQIAVSAVGIVLAGIIAAALILVHELCTAKIKNYH